MLERVLLHRDNSLNPEEVADLVRRHLCRDAAVHGHEGSADLRPRNRLLNGRGDFLRDALRMLLVGVHGPFVLVQLLASHAWAGRCEACHRPAVGRRRVVIILDHDVDRRGISPSKQRRIGLRDVSTERFCPDVRRLGGQWRRVELSKSIAW